MIGFPMSVMAVNGVISLLVKLPNKSFIDKIASACLNRGDFLG